MAKENPPTPEHWTQLAETSVALNLIGFFVIWIDSVEASVRDEYDNIEYLENIPTTQHEVNLMNQSRAETLRRLLEGEK
jgi:hypothetical protein